MFYSQRARSRGTARRTVSRGVFGTSRAGVRSHRWRTAETSRPILESGAGNSQDTQPYALARVSLP